MNTCVLCFSRRNAFEWRMRSRSRWNSVRTVEGFSGDSPPRPSAPWGGEGGGRLRRLAAAAVGAVGREGREQPLALLQPPPHDVQIHIVRILHDGSCEGEGLSVPRFRCNIRRTTGFLL